MTGSGLPGSFDPIYFSTDPWSDRVTAWVGATTSQEFADDNEYVVRQAISEPGSGLAVVINIGTEAILKLLPNGRYLNLYERPEVGGARQETSPEREAVDDAMDIYGPDVYFAAGSPTSPSSAARTG